MKLSLCIVTFNEEKFIHYPLDSAYDLASEVIIVDGGSQDRTVEIAKMYGKKIKIFHEDNPPMFHINKQKAIEKATGDWILQLDADEGLSEELKQEIKRVLASSSQHQASSPVAYWLPRKNFFLTRFLEKGGQYPDYTIRLYKNGVAKFPRKSVHEQVTIDPSIVIPSTSTSLSVNSARDLPEKYIGYLKSPLLHFADPDFSRYLKRWNRYTTLDAKLLVESGEKPSFFSYFFIKPLNWFLSTYIRHKGFMDGFAGFVFSLFSAIRFWAIYVKVWSHYAHASRDKQMKSQKNK